MLEVRTAPNCTEIEMTSGKAAAYGVGAALLVAYLAAANMPSGEPPSRERAARPAPAGPEALAGEVSAQAARLQARMAQAPVPDSSPRNPFAFGSRDARPAVNPDGMVRAAVAPETVTLPYVPPLPQLTLMGIAEETTAAGPKRTAVIGGEGDTIYMVVEGQPVGTRYKVTKIGADAIELEDLLTKGYRRIALR
jgi:Tfp pilus assembly protein PilP